MKKQNKKSFLSDKRLVLAVSLLTAILSWIVVAGFINPGGSYVIQSVMIDYKRNADEYRNRGLQIVGEMPDSMADVQVVGDGSVTGRLNNTDVAVFLDFSGVNGPGVHEVPLRGTRITQGNYDIRDISVRNSQHSMRQNPKNTVTLTFEEVETRHFPITVHSEGITADSGFFKDTPVLSNNEVVITGPRSEVARVAQVVAEIDGEEVRTESKMYQGEALVLLDSSGNVLSESQVSHLSLSPEIVDVEIPILERNEISIGVDFTGMQPGFDMEWFNSRVHLSADSLQVVGTTAAFQNLSTPLSIATFDMSQLGMGWVSDPVTIELPTGLRNQDQFKQVTASLDTAGMVEKTFRVTNFQVENGPRNAQIAPLPESVTVSLIGQQDQMEALLPENIVIQIDAFNVVARQGQQTIPARILVPRANRVFAVGDYPVVCDVVIE